MKWQAAIGGVVFSAFIVQASAMGIDEIPAIPAKVISAADAKSAVEAPPPKARSVAKKAQASHNKEGESIVPTIARPIVIKVVPGVNQILPIAKGHINRIITPFSKPLLNTVSNATFDIHKNVIYVSTSGDAPVTMFITPGASTEAVAISLTLVPKAIPPIEATLMFKDDSIVTGYFDSEAAQAWETDQPYVETIKSMLRKIALGDLPPGYSISDFKAGDQIPTCMQEGMSYEFVKGQFLRGHHFNVAIGVVTNVSDVPMEIHEETCVDQNIAAVAAWPNNVIAPGQGTELYVVLKTRFEHRTTKRKSLLEE